MLNIGSDGSSNQFVKYNAKSGRWSRRNEAGEDVDIPNPTFIADMANIQTGWLRFREGQAPDRVLDPSLQQEAPKPIEADFKRGFVLKLYSQQCFGGTVELSSCSMHLCNAIRDAYATYAAARDNFPGQVPVFSCVGVTPSKDKFGTNYKPTLTLTKWVPRPTDLPDLSVDAADQETAARPQPPPTAVHLTATEF
jgi:hypothetical protein